MRYEKKAAPFYSTKAWRQARTAALRRDHYMCVECLREFEQCGSVRPQPATMVHHIIPITERPDLALDVNNLESLCENHHAKKHPEKGNRAEYGNPATISPTGMTIVKIT